MAARLDEEKRLEEELEAARRCSKINPCQLKRKKLDFGITSPLTRLPKSNSNYTLSIFVIFVPFQQRFRDLEHTSS